MKEDEMKEDELMDMNKSINPMLKTALDIANALEHVPEESINEVCLKRLGCGYRLVTDRLRNGAVDVIKLQQECIHETANKEYYKSLWVDAKEFVEEVFGAEIEYDEFTEDEIDELKTALKDTMEKIMKERFEEYGNGEN